MTGYWVFLIWLALMFVIAEYDVLDADPDHSTPTQETYRG